MSKKQQRIAGSAIMMASIWIVSFGVSYPEISEWMRLGIGLSGAFLFIFGFVLVLMTTD